MYEYTLIYTLAPLGYVVDNMFLSIRLIKSSAQAIKLLLAPTSLLRIYWSMIDELLCRLVGRIAEHLVLFAC
jgi:hypothetical protein